MPKPQNHEVFAHPKLAALSFSERLLQGYAAWHRRRLRHVHEGHRVWFGVWDLGFRVSGGC